MINESDLEIWKINEKFIQNQFDLGKTFYFSHDPIQATGFYQQEIDFLKQIINQKYNKPATFIRDNQYWKLVW